MERPGGNGLYLTNHTPPLPPYPTAAPPGSREKLEVMEQRVLDGYTPTHPDDLRDDDISPGFSSLLALRGNPCEEKENNGQPDGPETSDWTDD